MTDLIPPQSIDIEQSLIGACLLSPDSYKKAVDVLSVEDFYKTAHQKIFETINDLAKSDSAIDLITVSNALKKSGKLEEIGGEYYLSQCIDRITSHVHTADHARIIKHKSDFRKLITISHELSTGSYEMSADPDKLIEIASQELFSIIQGTTEKKFIKLSEAVNTAIDNYQKAYQEEKEFIGLASGINLCL